MQNEFTDIYKKLSIEKLLEIIANEQNYAPEAIETAHLEITSRKLSNEEIEKALKNNSEKASEEHTKQQRFDIPVEKVKKQSGKLLELFNPIGKKTAENIVNAISVLLIILVLYRLINSFNYISFIFSENCEWDLTQFIFLTEIIYLLVMTFLFIVRKTAGWIMIIIMLGYQLILDGMNYIIWYNYIGIDDNPFMSLIEPPSFPELTFTLLFHISLLYFLLKKETRLIFLKHEQL